MSELNRPSYEALAQALAGGMNLRAACVAAGLSPAGLEGVVQRPAFKARMAELRAQQDALGRAGLEKTILALLHLATAGDQATAAARKEARMAHLEAHRLDGLLLLRSRQDTLQTLPRPMTEAEWDAKYGPDAPGGGLSGRAAG